MTRPTDLETYLEKTYTDMDNIAIPDYTGGYSNILRMYCIDTEALVFMFNGGSPYGFTIHPIFTRICML